MTLLCKLKPKIIPELTNNLLENMRCVDIMKQILATDFWHHLKNQTNGYANEKIIFDEPCTTTSPSEKAVESQWFDATADELQLYCSVHFAFSDKERDSSVVLEQPVKYRNL
jgi:hypothetical protein